MVLSDYKQIRKQKDWITFQRNKKPYRLVNVISYMPKYKWEVRIASLNNYPILTKQNITKAQALAIAKKYMKAN